MIIYKRDIKPRLLGLRLLLVASTMVAFYSFNAGLKNAGYASVVLFIFSSIIKVTGLNIYDNKIELNHFYFFSLIPTGNGFDIDTGKLKLIKKHVDEEMPASDTALDLILLFFRWKGYVYRLELKNEIGNGAGKKVSIHISDKEYAAIAEILKSQVEAKVTG